MTIKFTTAPTNVSTASKKIAKISGTVTKADELLSLFNSTFAGADTWGRNGRVLLICEEMKVHCTVAFSSMTRQSESKKEGSISSVVTIYLTISNLTLLHLNFTKIREANMKNTGQTKNLFEKQHFCFVLSVYEAAKTQFRNVLHHFYASANYSRICLSRHLKVDRKRWRFRRSDKLCKQVKTLSQQLVYFIVVTRIYSAFICSEIQLYDRMVVY